jgi:hypothetical protein
MLITPISSVSKPRTAVSSNSTRGFLARTKGELAAILHILIFVIASIMSSLIHLFLPPGSLQPKGAMDSRDVAHLPRLQPSTTLRHRLLGQLRPSLLDSCHPSLE